jgi:hypothetical protein
MLKVLYCVRFVGDVMFVLYVLPLFAFYTVVGIKSKRREYTKSPSNDVGATNTRSIMLGRDRHAPLVSLVLAASAGVIQSC